MRLKYFIHAKEYYTELPDVKKRSYGIWEMTFSFPFFTVMDGNFWGWNSVLQKFAHFSETVLTIKVVHLSSTETFKSLTV